MFHSRSPHPAVAAALTMARNPLQGGEKRLGMSGINIRPHFAPGGPPRAQMPPHRQPGEPIHTGPLNVAVPGRTDHIMVTVPEGAYVIPADVVNYWGEDNTIAGQKILDKMFHGSMILKLRQVAGHSSKQVPIAAAGGEYVVPPESVSRIGNGNIKHGSDVLDDWVVKCRKMHIKTLQKLPGPKRD